MSSQDTAGATAQLARWASSLRYEDIPAHVVAHMKLCLLDTLGCALYGATLPWGGIARQYAEANSGGGSAGLWGSPAKCGPADAALANGTAAHGYEIDDIHLRSLIHPGAVTVPAVLAVAEARAASGKDVLAALVAGYEVGLRVGIAAGIPHQLRGYHPTGTVGCLCSSAAVANLLRLDAAAAIHALAVGATQASGLYSAVRSGAMVKRMHAGRAAQSGVIAGLLAERGFTGSEDVLETPFAGFMSTLGHGIEIGTLCGDLGERWETVEVGFKVYAACASAHTIIDAVRALRGRGLTADSLVSLVIHMSRSAMNNVGWTYEPATVVSAQMNGYYAAAVTLLEGDAFIDQYAESRIADPRILALIPKVSIVHDPQLDEGGAATRHAVWVEAEEISGSRLTERVDQRRGSAKYPLGADEIERKFARTAAEAVSAAAARQIRDLVDALEREPGMERLSGLLAA